jgi:UDP-N-acetyl-D-mannosaminuronic acid dehydrogenase
MHPRGGGVEFEHDVVIVGGCGHVGLPLGLAFADRHLGVVLYDTNAEAVERVNAGDMVFREPGAPDVLVRALDRGLRATADPSVISRSEHVIVVVGTPVDAHLDPDPQAVPRAIEELVPHLCHGQLIVLRSTLFPGVTATVEKVLARVGLEVDLACCPERIAEGKAMTELYELPQIVSGVTSRATDRAELLFRCLTTRIVVLEPAEAELAKLFTNAWRYIKFATANQLFMMANDRGLDFEKIRDAIGFEYPRGSDIPQAGFAAGPCLLKDTMQLAAAHDNNFVLGHASMMINEGLPSYVVSRLADRYDLASMTVGILGMAFKGGSDDIRSSLSYKLKRILSFQAAGVLCTDPYVTVDPNLVSLDEVLSEADLLIVGAPHDAYLDVETDKPVIDIWNIYERGVRV